MNHANVAKWLKAACLGVGLVGGLVFLVGAPALAGIAVQVFPGFDYLYWPMLGWVWLIGLLCFLSLGRFWLVCSNIGADRSFVPENARAMQAIASYLLAAGVLATAQFLLLTGLKISVGAPLLRSNLWLLLLMAGVFLGVALIARALSLLVARAAELQEAQDLTV